MRSPLTLIEKELKFLFYILIISNQLQSIAQVELTDKFEIKNGWCTSSLFLYADSTYAFERSCEGNAHISLGKYSRVGKEIKLYPLEKNELDLIHEIKYDTLQKYSDTLKITFNLLNGGKMNTEFVVMTETNALLWQNGSLKNPEEYSNLGLGPERPITSENFRSDWKQSTENLAICLTGFENILGQRITIPVIPNAYNVTFVINLPLDITKITYIFDEEYIDISSEEFNFPNANIVIEN